MLVDPVARCGQRAGGSSSNPSPRRRPWSPTCANSRSLRSERPADTTSPMALVLFGVDHFKAINDTYGHGKGDEVLAAVGAITADTLRASDFVGHRGGLEAAEKLRAANRHDQRLRDRPGGSRRPSASRSFPTTPASPNSCSENRPRAVLPPRTPAATVSKRSALRPPRQGPNSSPRGPRRLKHPHVDLIRKDHERWRPPLLSACDSRTGRCHRRSPLGTCEQPLGCHPEPEPKDCPQRRADPN